MAAGRSPIWVAHQLLAIALPDPGGVGADLATGFILFQAPRDLTIKKLWHVPAADWVGAAAPNNGVITVKRNDTGVAIATLSVITNLAKGTLTSLGAIAATGALSEGDNLTIGIVTSTGTANAPASTIIVDFVYDADAATGDL